MEDIPMTAAGLAGLVALLFMKWYLNPLRAIPTLGGPSLPVLSFLAVVSFVRRPKDLIDEGYKKYYNSAFKVALLDKWVVVVCGPKMIEELKKRPDEELSTIDGILEFTQTTYTASPEILADNGHDTTTIVKENMTRGLATFTPHVVDEIQSVLREWIPENDQEWTSVIATKLAGRLIRRTTNRIFVGLPVCRNDEYLSLIDKHAADFMKTMMTMSLVPSMLKRFLGPKLSKVSVNVATGLSILGPVIEERKALMREYGGDWTGKPNDMLQWILDKCVPKGMSDEHVLERLLEFNLAASLSTANVLTHVLYHLAALPEIHEELRDEIEAVVAEEGWTAGAINKMLKLDSLVKETQRYTGIGFVTMLKRANKDLRLGDGTFVPKGTALVAAHNPMHHDQQHYPNPDLFDPFRFSRMREKDEDPLKHQFTTASVTFLPWGYGPHACPGRFFAAMELKATLANIIAYYDVKLGGDGKRPKDVCMAFTVDPAKDGVVLFRRRKGVDWVAPAV